MNKYFLLFLLSLGYTTARGQCLANSLVINTGYNPLTGTAITPGSNGGTPVTDPHWVLSTVTADVAGAIAITPITGLIEVVPGSPADVVQTLSPSWTGDPAGQPGGWISCLNSNQYYDDGDPSRIFNMTLSRTFRMCSDDNITLNLNIAGDNYVSALTLDGVTLSFSEPPPGTVSDYASFANFVYSTNLLAGTHTITFTVNNLPTTTAGENPTGLNVYGTVSSTSGLESLVSEGTVACGSYVCASIAANCNNIDLADTLHTCANSSITLNATITGTDSVLSTIWSPSAGLSDTVTLSPTASIGTTSTYYYLTMKSLQPDNLVANGNFSAGNADFSSSYIYFPPPSTILNEGDYSVDFNPHDVHTGFTSFGDHTTGTGNMMIINGGPTAVDVWCETIPVQPNTDYSFSAWFANCSSVTTGPNVPVLQFKINGVLIGTPYTVTSAPGVWVNFFSNWNSGANTTANICIYDATTTASGNDFVIDDISFQHYCTTKDSVYIAVNIPDTTTHVHDTALCISVGSLVLNATPGFASHLWSNGSTATNIAATATGTYWVKSWGGCTAVIDTFHVNFIPLPTVSIGNDTGFCTGNTVVLSATEPTGTTYLWSNGSTADTIHVSVTGTYWLRVYNGCSTTDSIHITVSTPPVVNLGPDIANCLGAPVTLMSAGSFPSATFIWNTGATTSSISAPASGTYWLQISNQGCTAADTIHVVIMYDTFTLYNNDTAICRGAFVNALTTLNPMATVQWLPTAGIAFPTLSSTTIAPDTSAMYHIVVSLPGCPPVTDSFYIDVQPNPVIVYAGGNRFVCQYDTIHMDAHVSPGWYSGYNYSWSPNTSLDGTTTPTVVFTAGISQTYTVTVTTSAGCKGVDSAHINVFTGSFATGNPDVFVCPHDSVLLAATGGGSYHWHPSLYLSDSTSATPWLHAVTSQDYNVVVTSPDGCKDTVTLHVTVWPAGILFLPDSAITLYAGESYQLSPVTNCVSFTWFPPAGLDAANIANPVATPDLSTRYLVTGMTEHGCVATDSIDVLVSGGSVIAVPNAFTPGESVNSILYLINKGVSSVNHFRIYNRWGNLVFETNDISKGWDGNFHGQPQPFGVYVYDIEAVANNGQIVKRAGNITLLRK